MTDKDLRPSDDEVHASQSYKERSENTQVEAAPEAAGQKNSKQKGPSPADMLAAKVYKNLRKDIDQSVERIKGEGGDPNKDVDLQNKVRYAQAIANQFNVQAQFEQGEAKKNRPNLAIDVLHSMWDLGTKNLIARDNKNGEAMVATVEWLFTTFTGAWKAFNDAYTGKELMDQQKQEELKYLTSLRDNAVEEYTQKYGAQGFTGRKEPKNDPLKDKAREAMSKLGTPTDSGKKPGDRVPQQATPGNDPTKPPEVRKPGDRSDASGKSDPSGKKPAPARAP